MKQNIDEINQINPEIKLKELYKYIQGGDRNKIIKKFSNLKKKKIINQNNQVRKGKNKVQKSRYNNSLNNNVESDKAYSETNENENIFTRIKPNLDVEYDSKTNYNHKIKQQNKNVIYKRSRTPNRKYCFYKKKKKRDSTDNTYSITYNTESKFQNNNSTYENIYDSLDENNQTQKPMIYDKKMNKLIKYGLKFELNNDNNNYIDLLTVSDIKTLENKINIKKLSKQRSPQQNEINKNNIYIKKNHTNKAINFNKKENYPQNNSINSRNILTKLIDEDYDNKSYDCIIFKEKIGLNKRRNIRKKRKVNSNDKYLNNFRKDNGTPIKKENDKGGKIVLCPKLFNKTNETINLINLNKKYFDAVVLIQNWWKKYNIYFIKKVCLIQRMYRDYLNRKNNLKILKKKISLQVLHKSNDNSEYNNKDNNLYKNNNNDDINKENNNDDINKENNKDDYKDLNEDNIILIQKKFREYLFNKMMKEKNSKRFINYIPKNICEMTKTRIRYIKRKQPQMNKKDKNINNKAYIKTNVKNNNNNIRTIRNGNINNNNNFNNKVRDKKSKQNEPKENKTIQLGKRHHYTRSKLALSPINKIFISQDTVKYETSRYTFLKKCYFRNREEDREENELNRLSTTEFMRKINLKLRGKYLTPDKRQKAIVNPLLQIDNLGEEANIQILSNSQGKNKQPSNTNKDNGLNNSNNNRKLYLYNLAKNNSKEIKDKKFKNNSNKIENLNSDEYKKDKKENPKEKNENIEGNINVLDIKSDSESNSIKIEELVETINIPKEYIAKCKMGEIIISKNKDKDEPKNNKVLKEEKEIIKPEEDEKKRLAKIIFIQRNIKIFLEKIKPKITKIKKTVLIIKNDYGKNEIKTDDKNNQQMENMNNIEYLIDNKNINDMKNKAEFEQTFNNEEQNNNNESGKKEDIISENSSDKDNFNENDYFMKPKHVKPETVLKISINNDKITNPSDENEIQNINKFPGKTDNRIDKTNNNEEMIYINKAPGKSRETINKKSDNLKNEEMKNINKIPSKAYNISKKINDDLKNKEMKYINKIPVKANNATIYSNNKINNEEMKYINKVPSKAYNLNKKINDNLKNEEIKYINKIPGKANNINTFIKEEKNKDEMLYINKPQTKPINLSKNIISNDEIKLNIPENIEDTSSSINIDDMRNSCPLKEVKKVNYKTYKKDYLENLLKENAFNFTINQLKEIGMHYKYFRFDYIIKMFAQKIQKVNKQFVFHKMKGEGFTKHKNLYFDVIKTYLNNKNLYINDDNDVSKLLKDTLQFYSNMYNKYKFIPYIKPDDEEKLINTQLFRRDENCDNLISFICNYLKLEKNITNFTEDLIKYHLNKNPINNFNIFGLTRYINSLYFILLYSKVDFKELNNKDNLNLSYININNDNEKEIKYNAIDNSIEINLSHENKNQKYVRKTINYKKANKISMKRHVMNLSSCDINNNSYENLPQANDSLIKKSIVK